MGCVTFANIVVLINGKPTDLFKSSRGLRQGFPLSPLLFLVFLEGTSRDIKEQVRDKKLEGISVARGLYITHLMFVDDIILIGNGMLVEWNLYKDLLELFSKDTGMTFSLQKSMFLEASWSVKDITLMKEVFPYDVKSLDEGFKYLGCFIKLIYYNKADWYWLVRKFEKMIANWNLRWLSLGGRVTLVKVVHESIHFYWLSLAKIPKSILNIIRRRMFIFMWNRKKEKEGIQLISWDKIANPKRLGG